MPRLNLRIQLASIFLILYILAPSEIKMKFKQIPEDQTDRLSDDRQTGRLQMMTDENRNMACYKDYETILNPLYTGHNRYVGLVEETIEEIHCMPLLTILVE